MEKEMTGKCIGEIISRIEWLLDGEAGAYCGAYKDYPTGHTKATQERITALEAAMSIITRYEADLSTPHKDLTEVPF